MPSYSGAYDSGEWDLWNLEISQPVAPSSYRTGVLDAAYFGKQVLDNIMGTIHASVGSPFYRQSFACASGLATGDPVILTGANAVDKAAASGSGTSKVIGFVREITAADTGCYLSHFWYKTGLTVAVNDTIYLTDAGGVSSGQGTFKHTLGIAISTTGALLQAGPRDGTLSSPDIGGDPATVGSGEDSGSATFAARADHKHALQFSGYPTGVGTGTADSGTLAVAARVDHVHKMRTGWDDIIIPIFGTRFTGSDDPDIRKIDSGGTVIRGSHFPVSGETFFIVELPHNYKEGTDLYPHVHWVGAAASGTEPVRFAMDIQWRSGTDLITISGTGEVTYSGSGSCATGWAQRYMALETITGTSGKIGQQIMGRFRRLNNGATNYASACYVQTIGIHFQMDSFGSLNETSKT